jgi:hypothetical protein
MKIASTRARTQSGTRFCTRALIREMKVTQAAPPTSITGASVLNLCKPLIATITNPQNHHSSRNNDFRGPSGAG